MSSRQAIAIPKQLPALPDRWLCVIATLLVALCAGCDVSMGSGAGSVGKTAPLPTAKTSATAPASESVAPNVAADKSSWPVCRADALATGVSNATLPENLEVLWKFNSNMHGFEATVAIENGLVFAGSLDGELYVLNLSDGKEVWKFHTELGFNGPPAVADGRVFVGDADGRFYCMEAATGKPLWGFETGGEIDSGPNFYKDRVLVGSQDATLYCFEQATGKLVWKYTIGDQVRCSPTVVEGRGFLAGCDAKLHILDLEKGEAIGSVEIDGPTGSTPAVGGDCVFFGTEGASFFAIDWRQAKIVWQLRSERNMPFRASAAVTPEEVIFAGHDKHVYAVDPKNGHERVEVCYPSESRFLAGRGGESRICRRGRWAAVCARPRQG